MALGTNDTNNLQLKTNNTTRLFISSSGNVGIGTTTPINTLQVNGGITIANFTQATSLHVSKSNGTNEVVYRSSPGYNIEQHFLIDETQDWVIGQDGSDNKFKISSANNFNSSNVRLTINSSGNVGIGTINPIARLHISGSTSGSILEPTSSGVPTFTGRDGQFIFGSSGGNHFIYVYMAGTWKSCSLS
jgi:hypothetical protein